jgi:alanyl-tRNA synthetase
MTADEIRKSFLDFFSARDHKIVPGIPLVPTDPSLLLTGAGVVQFRAYLEGHEKPPYPRAASCQRCVRTNDIELVGKTAIHCTFFEMLGNFSFGDYYKEETLTWGWEFLVDVCKLDPERIWGTYYPDDKEAHRIWTHKLGVPEERMLPVEGNFWGPVAATGACGPDSEAHYDLGPDVPGWCGKPVGKGKNNCHPECGCDRFVEVWNHVFTERFKHEDGSFTPLPKKNIDTGMGLERLVMAAQGHDNIYKTDLLAPIVAAVAEIITAGRKPQAGGRKEIGEDWRTKLIAEHARTVAFLILDGIIPSNEGRGYVLRRVLRRATRFGKLLGVDEPFLHFLMKDVVATMGGAYPELRDRREQIEKIVRIEDERFWDALLSGCNLLDRMLDRGDGKVLSGSDAFTLYDTYGFPLELTQEMAGERGVSVDTAGFDQAMARQRELGRVDRRAAERMECDLDPKLVAPLPDTEFVGHTTDCASSEVVAVFGEGCRQDSLPAGRTGYVVTAKTPFYAESGGQMGDTGTLTAAKASARVLDTQKIGSVHLHLVEVEEGVIAPGDIVSLEVHSARRDAIKRAHTATHLLHNALRMVLGDHVAQSGSLVEPDRLRFDFSHFGAVTEDEIERIERLVNERVLANSPTESATRRLDDAKEMGAIALFGEKYGEEVRVVRIGDYSMELCGGTHAERTGDIGFFLITSESSIGAGLRRIEALTGLAAFEEVAQNTALLRDASEKLRAQPAEIVESIEHLLGRAKTLEKEVEKLRRQSAGAEADEIVGRAVEKGGVKIVAERVETVEMPEIKDLVDAVAEKIKPGIVLIVGSADKTVLLVAKSAPELVAKGFHAGRFVKEIAAVVGGSGGGKPDFAQAGGKDPSKIDEALKAALDLAGRFASSAGA